jgi:hypothetical protein
MINVRDEKPGFFLPDEKPGFFLPDGGTQNDMTSRNENLIVFVQCVNNKGTYKPIIEG